MTEPRSELDFIRAGVRFSWASAGVLRVQGPRDEALAAALRDAIASRRERLVDLSAAREATWAAYRASGKPVAVRHEVECLPYGVCETCGDSVVSLIQRGGKTLIRTDCGSGMCVLCNAARHAVVVGVEKEAA